MKTNKAIRFATITLMVTLFLGLFKGNAIASMLSRPVDLTSIEVRPVENVTTYPQSMNVKSDVIELSLCFDLPNNADWMPIAYIASADVTIEEGNVSLQNYKDPETMDSLHRCYDYVFPNRLGVEKGQSVTIIVNKLVRHISPLTENGFKQVLAKVQRENPNINFKIVIEPGEMGSGANLYIISKPDDLTEADISKMVHDASQEELILDMEFEILAP